MSTRISCVLTKNWTDDFTEHLLHTNLLNDFCNWIIDDQDAPYETFGKLVTILGRLICDEEEVLENDLSYIFALLKRIDIQWVLYFFEDVIKNDSLQQWIIQNQFEDLLLTLIETSADPNVVKSSLKLIEIILTCPNFRTSSDIKRMIIILSKISDSKIEYQKWKVVLTMCDGERIDMIHDLIQQALSRYQSCNDIKVSTVIVSLVSKVISTSANYDDMIIYSQFFQALSQNLFDYVDMYYAHESIRILFTTIARKKRPIASYLRIFIPKMMKEVIEPQASSLKSTSFTMLNMFSVLTRMNPFLRNGISEIPNFTEFIEENIKPKTQIMNQKYGGEVEETIIEAPFDENEDKFLG